jgi:tetratricopeptide (TPR) repeat protein
MRLTTLVIAVLLLAPSGCVPPPAIPRAQLDGWSIVDVGQVRLLGDVPPEEIQRLADDLALFDATFAHLVGWSPTAGAVPVTVFLIRNRELARRFDLERWFDSWAHVTLDGAFSVVLARADYASTRSTLFHEYTHVLLRRGRRAPLPPWYDEGVASFFGTLDARGGAVVVGAPPAAAVFQMRSRGLVPLDELFEGFRHERNAQEIADFYATSWALSHYLLITPSGRREMSRLVDELSRGAHPEQAQHAAFGRAPSELESEVREHVAHLARGVPSEVVFELDALDIHEAGRATPLSFPDAAGELGQMALERARAGGGANYRALAKRLFEMSASQQPRPARFEAAFAEALAFAGQMQDAMVALRGALARAPNDPRVRLRAGRVELARAQAAETGKAASALDAAEAHFRESLALNPGSASAWFELGRALHQAARPNEALSALRNGRRLGWSPRLDLALGELELESGRSQRAFELLWPLVQDPHGGRTRDEASRLLEEAGLLPEVGTGSKRR